MPIMRMRFASNGNGNRTESGMELQELKVLLVENNPGDARLLREELSASGADGDFELTCVEDLRAALQILSERRGQLGGESNASFDAMLLDLNLPDSQGLETFHAVHSRAPWLPVVLLSGSDDEATGLRAVQQGAQDYLVKGRIGGGAVARSLRYAVERNRSLQWHRSRTRHSARGRIISFAGVKGGVGTTTVALNAAAVLSLDKLVIAAELRPDYGSFAAHFRRLSGGNLGEIYKRPAEEIDEAQLEQRLINSELGFYLLFGPQSISDFQGVSREQAEGIVSTLSRMADFVVLDLPSHADAAQEAAVRRSNAVVLVSERDDVSLMAARMAAMQMERWGVSEDAISMVIVNKAPMGDPVPAEKIEDIVGLRVLGMVPPAPDICAGAQKSSAPLVLYRPRSAPASILTSIAQRAGSIAVGSAAIAG